MSALPLHSAPRLVVVPDDPAPSPKRQWPARLGLGLVVLAVSVPATLLVPLAGQTGGGSDHGDLPYGVVAVCAWDHGPNPAGLPLCSEQRL